MGGNGPIPVRPKAHLRALFDDRHGWSALKFVLTACLTATIALSISPEFRNHPLVKKPLDELRSYSPETVSAIMGALKR